MAPRACASRLCWVRTRCVLTVQLEGARRGGTGVQGSGPNSVVVEIAMGS